jgi:hypothetical protein
MKAVRVAAGAVAGLAPILVLAGPAAVKAQATAPAPPTPKITSTGKTVRFGGVHNHVRPEWNHNSCAGVNFFEQYPNNSGQWNSGFYLYSAAGRDVCVGTIVANWAHLPGEFTVPTSVRFRMRGEPSNKIISSSFHSYHIAKTMAGGGMVYQGSSKYRRWYPANSNSWIMVCAAWMVNKTAVQGTATCTSFKSTD